MNRAQNHFQEQNIYQPVRKMKLNEEDQTIKFDDFNQKVYINQNVQGMGQENKNVCISSMRSTNIMN